MAPFNPARAIYTAKIVSPEKEGTKVVVKFTQRYSRDAHKLLADISLAPELLYHELIEGTGVHFVVMEHIEGTPIRDQDELRDDGKAAHAGLLLQALQTLNAGGFVFRDLWELNILITEDGLKLVDFDWCMKCESSQYSRLSPQFWRL